MQPAAMMEKLADYRCTAAQYQHRFEVAADSCSYILKVRAETPSCCS